MSNLGDISGRLQKRLLFVAVIISFLIFVFVSIPVIMDNKSVQKAISDFILTQFRQGLHLKQDTPESMLLQGITLYSVKFSLFPFPTVDLSDIKITAPPLKNITIDKLSIVFSPDSFTKKQFLVKNITIQNPVIPSSASFLSFPFKQEHNLFDYLEEEQKDFSININNLTSDIFKKADIQVLIAPVKKSISADITIHDFTLPDFSPINNTNNHPQIISEKNINSDKTFTAEQNLKTDKNITIKKIICSADITENESTIEMNHIAIPHLCNDLYIQFKHKKHKGVDSDKVVENTKLLFSGKDVNVDAVRPVVLKLLPDNHIADKIFQILYGGVVKEIEVLFKKNRNQSAIGSRTTSYLFSKESIRELFNPLIMIINGDVKNGTINIPATHLTATETDAVVTVKEGILHTEILKGLIDKSRVNNGTLDVNLVNQRHHFSGEFDISADLAHLNNVLQELLPNRSVSKELALLRDIQGETKGTLKLEGEKHHKPSIIVNANDIKLKGIYPRFPQKFSIVDGNLKYNSKTNNITIDNINGSLGKSRFLNFGASLTLDKSHLLKIGSGKAELAIEQVLLWFTSLKTTSSSILPLIKSSNGNIYLKEIAFKGELMKPETWDYFVEGNCNSIKLGQDRTSNFVEQEGLERPSNELEQQLDRASYSGEISDIKADFLISPSLKRISLANAVVQDTSLISAFIIELMRNGFINQKMFNRISVVSDIRAPFTIKDVYFEQKMEKKLTQKNFDKIKNGIQSDKIILNNTYSDNNAYSDDIEIKGELLFHNNLNISLNREKISNEAFEYQIKILKNGVDSATILFKEGNFNEKNSLQDGSSINFIGRLNTKDIEEVFNPMSASYKSLISFTDGRDITIESLQPDNYTITIDRLDLDFILEKQKLISVPLASLLKEKSSKKDSSPIVLTLNSEKFTDKKIIIVPFSARIVINGRNRNITIDNMQMCNVNGSIEVNITKESTDFFLTLQDDNKKIEPVIDCFYHGDRLMQGNYSLKASLYARGDSNNNLNNRIDETQENSSPANINIKNFKSIIKQNLTGRVEMTSDGGRIFRLTLLSRILSMLNISKLMEGQFPDIEQNGFAFSSINIVADVRKSRLILKHAVINGVDMTLLFTGWIDIFTRKIDLTCLVAPLKTADRIIGKIPIINTMLRGRLISVPVKATGTLNNPEVTILDPSEVGKTIINTMVDIITTPFKLLDNIQSETTQTQ
ncbi:MAG: AsmA-like C-terminal domain-containing protein [Desulfamplus sp.]|nr:AsmA-like C-terminal domain-containing protein [Desulfamplus sp.]